MSGFVDPDAGGGSGFVDPDAAPKQKPQGFGPSASAGAMNLATTLLGLPVDTVENALNLGIAGVGRLSGAFGGPTPNPLQGSVGGSEWLRNVLRGTGANVLSPDNPNPQDTGNSLVYDFVSRGGPIPGGAIPAISSIGFEKALGPQWAGVGAMAPAAGRMAARSAAEATIPRVPPDANAALLQSEGVQLTPGQMLGGGVKRAEDAATSIPVLGDVIKGAQRRGIEQFDAAAFNRALTPIGETLPKGMTGNKAVDHVYSRLGEKYEDLLPRMKGELYGPGGNALPARPGQPGPVTLKQELDGLRTMGQNMAPQQAAQLDRILFNEIESRFTQQGLASGETLKKIESQLGRMAKDFRKSENYDVRQLGDAVQEAQNAVRRMVERVNPSHGAELQKINEGYANFKVVQNAAGSLGAQEGVFTPTQLNRSVRAKDQSKDKARFAEGNALMQDLSGAGRAVLPSSVPDSGTATRSLIAWAIANPVKAAIAGVPVGIASLPYTPFGQRAVQSIVQRQPMQPTPLLRSGLPQGILSQEQE